MQSHETSYTFLTPLSRNHEPKSRVPPNLLSKGTGLPMQSSYGVCIFVLPGHDFSTALSEQFRFAKTGHRA
jgi:hypothetical protein